MKIGVFNRHGKVVAVATVDDDMSEFVRSYNWRLDHGYVYAADGHCGRVWLHKLVLGIDDSQVDHINGNPLDCRRQNLRPCTQAQNNQNVSNKGGCSQYRGVTWEAKKRLWRAHARLNGKRIWLGRFKDEAEAARAALEFRRAHMPFAVER